MDMNKAFFLKKEDRAPQWHVIDASGRTLGRLATELAERLRGKDKATFTPHADGGDYLVVVNAEKVVLTGKKWKQKEYIRYSGWIGGKKVTTALELRDRRPTELLRLAVKRMLPKNRLSREVIKKLKLYAGPEHPHQAQV